MATSRKCQLAVTGCRDTTLAWSELRQRVSGSDARLLLRTKALDLAIRENCVVFDFGVIRGYADDQVAVLLVDQEPSRRLAMKVEQAVRAAVAAEVDATFALVVLEGVFEEAYDYALRSVEGLDGAIRRELAGMADLHAGEAARSAALYRLLPLETALRDEAVRARRVYALVADALRDDVLATHAPPVLVGQARSLASVELAEAVFENSLCRWEFVNDAIEQLAGTIDATRKLVELALDNERNRLERMDIHLNIGALGMGLVSAVGGVFGMNLLIGLENQPRWFNRVVLATLLASALLCHACWRHFHAGYRQHAHHVHAVVSLLHQSIAERGSAATIVASWGEQPSNGFVVDSSR